MESNDSIIFRSGLIMGGIVLLALLSMTSSVFIAESTKGDATAINLAGSLRMQSYRIATRLQPVSYTHLDVYKRQGAAPSGTATAGSRMAGGHPPLADHHPIKPPDRDGSGRLVPRSSTAPITVGNTAA